MPVLRATVRTATLDHIHARARKIQASLALHGGGDSRPSGRRQRQRGAVDAALDDDDDDDDDVSGGRQVHAPPPPPPPPPADASALSAHARAPERTTTQEATDYIEHDGEHFYNPSDEHDLQSEIARHAHKEAAKLIAKANATQLAAAIDKVLKGFVPTRQEPHLEMVRLVVRVGEHLGPFLRTVDHATAISLLRATTTRAAADCSWIGTAHEKLNETWTEAHRQATFLGITASELLWPLAVRAAASALGYSAHLAACWVNHTGAPSTPITRWWHRARTLAVLGAPLLAGSWQDWGTMLAPIWQHNRFGQMRRDLLLQPNASADAIESLLVLQFPSNESATTLFASAASAALPPPSHSPATDDRRVCWHCNRVGHIMAQCPQRPDAAAKRIGRAYRGRRPASATDRVKENDQSPYSYAPCSRTEPPRSSTRARRHTAATDAARHLVERRACTDKVHTVLASLGSPALTGTARSVLAVDAHWRAGSNCPPTDAITLLDTCSTINVVSESFAQQIGAVFEACEGPECTVRGVGGAQRARWRASAECEIGGARLLAPVLVLPDHSIPFDALLGTAALYGHDGNELIIRARSGGVFVSLAGGRAVRALRSPLAALRSAPTLATMSADAPPFVPQCTTPPPAADAPHCPCSATHLWPCACAAPPAPVADAPPEAEQASPLSTTEAPAAPPDDAPTDAPIALPAAAPTDAMPTDATPGDDVLTDAPVAPPDCASSVAPAAPSDGATPDAPPAAETPLADRVSAAELAAAAIPVDGTISAVAHVMATRAAQEPRTGAPARMPAAFVSPSTESYIDASSDAALRASYVEKKVFTKVTLAPAVETELRPLLERYADVFGDKSTSPMPPVLPDVVFDIPISAEALERLQATSGGGGRGDRPPSDLEVECLERFVDWCVSTGRLIPAHKMPPDTVGLHAGLIAKAFCVPKEKNPTRWDQQRVVVDLRVLNSITYPFRYPPPDIAAVHVQLSRFKYKCKLDLLSWFWQVPVSKNTTALSATAVLGRLYYWAVSPQGLGALPAFFQQLAEQYFLVDGEPIFVVADDICWGADNLEDLVRRTELVLTAARRLGATVAAEKTFIGFETLDVLGRSLRADGGIVPTGNYLATIAAMPLPTKVQELRRFIGLFAAMAAHVPSAAEHTRALIRLIPSGGRKTQKINWTPEAVRSFERAKALASAPTALKAPLHDVPFVVLTDWSTTAGAAALVQVETDGSMRVIDALAHGAKHGEKSMSAAEGELAMVRLASRRWRSFLLGRENYWVTDSQKMASLLSSERMSSNPRLVRTANELLEFQFSPIHVAGDRNVILDTLSRLDHLPPDEFHLTDVPLADIQSAAAQWVDRTAAAMRAATQTLLLMDAAQPVAPPASGALLVPRPAAPAADAIAVRWRTLQQGDPSLAALRATAEAARARSSTVATLQDESAAAVLRDAPRPPLSQRTDRRVARYDPRGLLYVGERRAADTRLWIWRAVVPAPLRRQQALLTHADPLAGHFSASKTAESLLRTQWWPGLRETVRATVDACKACQMSQQPRQPVDGGDLERLVGDRPIRIDEIWQCDTFTHASQKFFHIIDLFSSFHWVVPVPDGRAASCREALLMAISHGGRPRICSFDGGKEFAGGFRSILLGLGIEPHVGIPYHPNSQSAVERGHRSLRASLASMKAMALQLDVDESPTAAMARAVAALNMTAGGAANSPSPYEKRTGVAPVPAACIDLRPLLVDPDADLSAQDRAAIVDFQLMKASQDAARTDRVVQRSEHRARLERRQNGERPPMAFAPHDRVRVLRAIGTGGLESEGRADADVYRFVGPYRVEEVDPVRRMVTVKLDIPLKFGETEEEDAPRVMLQRRSVHESIVRHYHEETDAELPEDMRYDPTSGAVMLKPPGVEWPSQSDVDERIFNALPPGLKKLAERRRRSAGRAAEREQRQAEAARKAEEERRLAEERRRERMRLLEEAEKERESRRRSEAESNEEKNKIVKISGMTNLRGSDKFIVSGTTSNGLPVVKAYDVCDEDEKSIADAFRGKPAPVVPADRSVGRPKRTRRRPAKFKRSAERIWDDGLDEEERADGDDEWVGETSDEE